jgi:hypothetical protein
MAQLLAFATHPHAEEQLNCKGLVMHSTAKVDPLKNLF